MNKTFNEKIQELTKYMADKNMFEFCCEEGVEDFFDKKADELFGEDFTYFRWSPDNETFDIAEAFQDVFTEILESQTEGTQIANTYAGYFGKNEDVAIIITYK